MDKKIINKEEVVLCKCGCGELRPKYDKKGRERRFIYGHQNRGDNNPTKKLWVRKILSEAQKGKKLSKETIEKIRIGNLNKIGWSRGLTKETNKILKKMSEKSKGRKLPLSQRQNISIGVKNNLPSTAFKKGHPSPNKGKTWEEFHGVEKAEKIKKKTRKARAKQIVPLEDTSIELKIQDFLTLLKIEFFTHKYMNIKHSYQCDILIPEQIGIPKKIIIECDGDFFHCNPNKFKPNDRIFKNDFTAKEKWKLDEVRTKELIQKGFRVLRLWENEINKMELNEFFERLNEN